MHPFRQYKAIKPNRIHLRCPSVPCRLSIQPQRLIGQDRAVGLNIRIRIVLGGLQRVENPEELGRDEVDEDEINGRIGGGDAGWNGANEVGGVEEGQRSMGNIVTYARTGLRIKKNSGVRWEAARKWDILTSLVTYPSVRLAAARRVAPSFLLSISSNHRRYSVST
jgi:hypothetical protein